MATVVQKTDLKYEAGYLTHQGMTVAPGFVSRYIRLDAILQEMQWENENAVKVEAFKPATLLDTNLIKVPVPNTPLIDEDAARADKVGDELKQLELKDTVQQILDDHNSVVEFVCNDALLIYPEDYKTVVIDTPALGNPLELTKSKLLSLVMDAVGYKTQPVLYSDEA